MPTASIESSKPRQRRSSLTEAMAEEGKKISFGFSKIIKKPVLQNAAPVEEKKVDYIECVDEKAIKIIGGEEKEDEPLVIPMLGSKTWHDRIINKVDADIYELKQSESEINDKIVPDIPIKQEKVDNTCNGNTQNENTIQPMDISEIKKEPVEETKLTLEEQAAREIIQDLHSGNKKNEDQKVFTVPIADDDLKGKEESTLDDYENIPIDAFGMAMLRGMGWQPGKGIGKNEKVVPPKMPELRPKGMGLGADKSAVQKKIAKLTKEEQDLKLIKGSFVRIIAGKQSGYYGKVEGLDDDTGRAIVRLALGNELVSINELCVQPVTATEYADKSKVLNVQKLEKYKNKETSQDTEKSSRSKDKNKGDSDSDQISRKREELDKKSKKRRDQSSDDESSPERKSRRQRDSSSSSIEEIKQKVSKKSKKHKSRDSSSERSRKKKKKDKEREKTKHKKSDYSDSPERIKHKKRRRSRSRSKSPKSRKRSRSRSKSPKSRRRSRSRSKSPKSRRRSRSRSKSPKSRRRSNSRSKSPRNRRRDRSYSPKNHKRERSRSRSPRNRRRDRSRSYSSRR